MTGSEISLEPLTEEKLPLARAIRREDVSEEFVDSIDTIWALTEYGTEHGCIGRTYLAMFHGACIGLILMGEALPWETDPPQMSQTPFYRLMGFVIDRKYRGRGVGGHVLESAIARCYQEFGPRPIALGVHKDNTGAERFYLRHGFHKTPYMEGSDYYFLRFI